MAPSSAHEHHHFSNPYGATAAPPPTPANQSNLCFTTEAADALSSLIERLPPTLNLSLRSRRSSDSTITTAVPSLISLNEHTPAVLHSNILSAASSHGFFQLTDHSISSDLAKSAESDCISLFNLKHEEKSSRFQKDWPVGYDGGDDDDDDDDNETGTETFCFDSELLAESTDLELNSLTEFTNEMKKLGMEVFELVFRAFGFENLTHGVYPLMWISQIGSKNRPNLLGRMYPYLVGLQYQIRSEKHTMLTDAGRVSVSPRMGSVLVTLGDIAQVWCNGNLKKVRSRPLPVVTDKVTKTANSISMTLLITLPLETIVSPLLPKFFFGPHSLPKSLCGDDHEQDDQEKHDSDNCVVEKEKEKCVVEKEKEKEKRLFNSSSFEDYDWRIYHEQDNQEKRDSDNCVVGNDEKEKEKEKRLFNLFSFEDYAWRIYHERLPTTKDPLAIYRV